MIIGDLIRRNAELHGDRVGLVFERHRFTHRQFASRAYRAANALLNRGILPQDRVAMLARNCNEVLEVFAAGDVVGIISVNINHRLSTMEIEDICADAKPSAFIFEADFAEVADALRAKLPDIRHFICIGGKSSNSEEYEAVLASASDSEPAVRAAPDDLVHLIYTSGTTGRPKGVMFDHKAMLEGVHALTLDGGAMDPVTGLIVMPLSHIGARAQSLSFLLLGGTVVLHRTFDARAALETIQEEKITAMHAAPIMIQRILEVPDRKNYDTRSLHCVRYASAPMPVPLLRRAIEAFGPIFNQVYGMSECLGVTTLKAHQHKIEGSEQETRRLASAGQPSLKTRLLITRSDGSEADRGEIGEILISAPSMMVGYWNNHSGTADALRRGWLRSQDLGYIDNDGFLFVLDRKKDMIVSGGENVYSWEVEEALRHHPAVAEVAVIAIPDPEWGESVKACVVLRDGMQASEDELIVHCRSRIGSYKKPRSIDFLHALPRLHNGKADKKALRAPYWAGQDRQVS